MENNKNTCDIAREIYQNAHTGLQSISNLLPEVDYPDVKEELLSEYEAYEKILGEISSYMVERGIKREDIGLMQKAMMWSSIKLKSLAGLDKNKIADMMIKGATNGLTELTGIKNSNELDGELETLLNKLLKIEEDSVESFKKFL